MIAEGRRWLESVLARRAASPDDELTARLCNSLSALVAGAERAVLAKRAIAIFEQVGDLRRAGQGYLNLAIADRQMAKFDEALAATDRVLELLESTSADRSIYYASTLGWRASALIGLQRYDEARLLFERDIALCEVIGDDDAAAAERLNFAELEFAAGNVRRALELVENSIGVFESGEALAHLGSDFSRVVSHLNATAYRLVLGEISQAQSVAREALVRARRVAFPLFTAIAVQNFAAIAALRGDAVRSARLFGFVEAVYAGVGAGREPTEARIADLLSQTLTELLNADEIAKLAAAGARLTEDDAVKECLAIV